MAESANTTTQTREVLLKAIISATPAAEYKGAEALEALARAYSAIVHGPSK